jgi:ketosteroid isomerase-like protein
MEVKMKKQRSGYQEKESSVETDIAAIREVLNQYCTTVTDGNLEQWIALWADNAIQMPPGAPSNVGKAKIMEAAKPAFDQFSIEVTVTSLEEIKVYGNLGFTRCNYSQAITPKAGGDKIVIMPDGKVLTLYYKQPDGSWKILYDCFNSNTPPNIP